MKRFLHRQLHRLTYHIRHLNYSMAPVGEKPTLEVIRKLGKRAEIYGLSLADYMAGPGRNDLSAAGKEAFYFEEDAKGITKAINLKTGETYKRER